MKNLTPIFAPLLALAICAAGQPAFAQDPAFDDHDAKALDFAETPEFLPPGLSQARLLPGWVLPNGNRMMALELQLMPGWKTYWRNPGEGGIPADFDWSETANLDAVQIHWPTPEVILSGGLRSLGYHNRLILPLEITPIDEDAALDLKVRIDFGLCETICVPGHLSLSAPQFEAADAASEPDPLIEAALQSIPLVEGPIAHCQMQELRDGVQIAASVPIPAGAEDSAAAMEFDGVGIWTSEPEIAVKNGTLTATADFIDESGKPFALDTAKVRLTLINGETAVEFEGCP